MDEHPNTVAVSFSGVVVASTTPNAQGSFSISTTASALGTVQGQATDDEQLTASYQFTLTNVAPQVQMFSAIQESGNRWTFTGVVSDEASSGLVITFGGLASLQGRTVTVGSNGMFSLTVTLANGEAGTATAYTTDGWSVNSNVAEYYVNPL